MQDPVIDEIIAELSDEFQLPKHVVRFIYMNYYKNVRDVIRSGDVFDDSTLKGVYIPRFGKIEVKSEKKIEKVRELTRRKRNV
jgi:hypothetical protein